MGAAATGSSGSPNSSRRGARSRSRSQSLSRVGGRGSSRAPPTEPAPQIDPEQRRDMVSRLHAMLHALEAKLFVTERDLEAQLEASRYSLSRAASDLMERSGLRQIKPGVTLRRIDASEDAPQVYDAWSECQAIAFKVRAGPNYRKTKIKAQAKPQPLYDVIAVDMYASDRKEAHLSRYMDLGALESSRRLKASESTPVGSSVTAAAATASPPGRAVAELPELFIINFMLPLTAPSMPNPFASATEPDGPTVCFHYVMRVSEWTRNNADHPSVELLSRFLSQCGPDGAMRERLKIIVQVANPDELNLGRAERQMYRQFNGLPFLYRTYNSRYHVGNGWFQADFDGHKSGYTTRAARYALLAVTEKIVANIAFLVEAETDEELPERILGCCTVHRLHWSEARRFVKPVATPLSPAVLRRTRVESPLNNVAEEQVVLEAGESSAEEAEPGGGEWSSITITTLPPHPQRAHMEGGEETGAEEEQFHDAEDDEADAATAAS